MAYKHAKLCKIFDEHNAMINEKIYKSTTIDNLIEKVLDNGHKVNKKAILLFLKDQTKALNKNDKLYELTQDKVIELNVKNFIFGVIENSELFKKFISPTMWDQSDFILDQYSKDVSKDSIALANCLEEYSQIEEEYSNKLRLLSQKYQKTFNINNRRGKRNNTTSNSKDEDDSTLSNLKRKSEYLTNLVVNKATNANDLFKYQSTIKSAWDTLIRSIATKAEQHQRLWYTTKVSMERNHVEKIEQILLPTDNYKSIIDTTKKQLQKEIIKRDKALKAKLKLRDRLKKII